jgi:hypothetical protein
MISNHYKTMTGMQSDTYFTGKIYPKLDAFIQNGKGEEIFYLCSSCQYRTQKRFKESIRELQNIAHNAIIIIKKGK